MDGALLLSRDGALIRVPGANMDRVYRQEVASRFYADSRRSWARYDGSLFRGLIEANELPTRAITRAMALRVLAMQAPPGDASIECHYCGTTTLGMDSHVVERCPSYVVVHQKWFLEQLSMAHVWQGSTIRGFRESNPFPGHGPTSRGHST